MRLFSSLFILATLLHAGPVDFALAELNSAMAERKMRAKNLVELSLDPPETFRIEPYRIGGAHITGGDLRGLMYGLLEAAAQIRATGHFEKAAGSPTVSLRGIRIVVEGPLERASEEFWVSYFRMLAHNRFNRIHVVFPRLEKPYGLLQFLSHTAAEYGIDFTLGVGAAVTSEALAHLLMLSPAIRGVAPEPGAAHLPILSAMRVTGRRVTLDLDTASAHPKMLEELNGNISLLRASSAWPPSFEWTPVIDVTNPGAHALLDGLVGKLSYDSKAKPPKDVDAAEYNAARDAVLWIGAAQQSTLGGSDYVASPSETARNREDHAASAKFTPADIAERLYTAAGRLANSAHPDLQLLAGMARQEADRQIAAANFPASANAPAPSTWTHTPPLSTPSEQPLALAFHLAEPKSISAVRLHYRPLDPAAATKTIEVPAAADITFTIPGADITGNWDLLYFFEILHENGNGWFEPDPLTAAPYRIVRVIAPHTGRN